MASRSAFAIRESVDTLHPDLKEHVYGPAFFDEPEQGRRRDRRDHDLKKMGAGQGRVGDRRAIGVALPRTPGSIYRPLHLRY